LNQFSALGLQEPLIKALDDVSIHSPTEIQAKAIPLILEYDPDFIGLAQTGTGKTAAFLLPLLQLVDPSARTTQALIVAPTRELVQQIHTAFKTFKKYLPKISSEVVYGGTPVHKQANQLKKKPPQILMGTPGRLIDLIKRKAIRLDTCQYLVLDEADEMLNMGFQEDVDEILKHTKSDRKIWLFSATMPAPIRNLVNQYMDSPQEVRVRSQQRTNENIEHEYILVEHRDKFEALKRIIDYIPELYCVIFCKTKMDTQNLADALNRDGYKAGAIHGDLSQQQRNRVLGQFKSGSVNILAATDVVARGIDIDDLTHVIHYALPNDREYYTHRSGRTARAGKKGTSLSIVSPNDQHRLRFFENSLKINIQKIQVPRRTEIEEKKISTWLEKLSETEISINEFPEQAIAILENYSKEEILAKIISQELDSNKKKGGKDDLNAQSRGGRGRRDRDEGRGRDKGKKRGKGNRDRAPRDKRTKRSGGGDYVPIFINVGKSDKLDKVKLLKYISKESGFSKGEIGHVSIHKQYSIFELESSKVKVLDKAFKKARHRGRKVKVHVDKG